jgi:hypothetical protein
MRTIKLYENFGQDRLAFSSKVGREDTHLTLYDEPMDMRNALINGGVVNWDIAFSKKSWGIALGDTPTTITSMRFDYEVEDEDNEDGDYVEKEWEIPEGVFSPEQFTTELKSSLFTLKLLISI